MRHLEPDGRQPEGDVEELSVQALTTAEAMLVWGVRHWVSCLKAGGNPIPLLLAGFGSAGAAAAVRPLEAILLVTLEAAIAPRDVRCARCPSVGAGEADLLAAVALQQAGREQACMARLRLWLPLASARIAQESVTELANELHHRGLIIPMRREYGAWREGGNHPIKGVTVPVPPTVH